MLELTNENLTKLYIATSTSLTSEMSEAGAESGEVLICDVQTDRMLHHAVLKEGRKGGYVEGDTFLPPTYPLILRPATYLVLLENGAKPTDLIHAGGAEMTLQEIFASGTNRMIVQAINQYLSLGACELSPFLRQMRAWWQREDRFRYEDYELIQLSPMEMLVWLNVVARGEGFKSLLEDTSYLIKPEHIRSLQSILPLQSADDPSWISQYGHIPVSGITHVTGPAQARPWARTILFAGYFPGEAPQYSVYVRLNRGEKIQDKVRREWPELGIYAVRVCERIAGLFKRHGWI